MTPNLSDFGGNFLRSLSYPSERLQIKCPAVFVNGYSKRLLVLMPSPEGWATAGHFITGKCLRYKTVSIPA
ncbi:hypothetical protein [Scytonema sp. PCC 10023]|uniref:hypothetical protein n=1 Tax=Scytonema sp. PCC 10023 TaxID=1680591 RepID=UPI0039C5BD5E